MTYDEAVADAYCPCHGEPWGAAGRGRRTCRVKRREYQNRFTRTPKGRAWMKRNNHTARARAAKVKYNQTEKGRASQARANSKRVMVGVIYVGRAPRAEQAAELNALARDFRAQQKGRA